MSQIKELLVHQLQDLLNAETQLTEALPKMANAANHPKLKEALEKHLQQTESQVQRLHKAFEALGEKAESRPCKGMTGLIEEGEEVMKEGGEKTAIAADLALIASAQKVEHYEIASYGTARCLARQLGENQCARLLSHSLGEEESADFLLTMIADPLLQQLALDDGGADVNLEGGESRISTRRRKTPKQERAA
jgi:Mn-containing catalase